MVSIIEVEGTYMATVKVQCTYTIDVEVPDDPGYDVKFDIEENHCPGTGVIGAAFEKVREECEAKRTCWACQLQGENKIISDTKEVNSGRI